MVHVRDITRETRTHTISHRVFRKSHRNFETPGSTLPDPVFRRGKKELGTLELDTIRLCFCFVRWIAVTTVTEAGYEGSMVRSILMAIKHVRHPLRPCPRPCLPSGLLKVPPFDRGHSELPSHLFPKGKHQVWGELPGSFEDLAGFSKDPVRYSIRVRASCTYLSSHQHGGTDAVTISPHIPHPHSESAAILQCAGNMAVR